jgi:hypothetical protein
MLVVLSQNGQDEGLRDLQRHQRQRHPRDTCHGLSSGPSHEQQMALRDGRFRRSSTSCSCLGHPPGNAASNSWQTGLAHQTVSRMLHCTWYLLLSWASTCVFRLRCHGGQLPFAPSSYIPRVNVMVYFSSLLVACFFIAFAGNSRNRHWLTTGAGILSWTYHSVRCVLF